jgi:hypothetical protein
MLVALFLLAPICFLFSHWRLPSVFSLSVSPEMRTRPEDDNESTMTAGQMTDPHALESDNESMASSVESLDAKLRSTKDNNLIIMLNGEMVYGKKNGESAKNAPRGGFLPNSSLMKSPAMVSQTGIREANTSLRVHNDSIDSHVFDQSILDPDLSYNQRPISPIDDASVGSMQHIAREIDMMEGSYFTSIREQPTREPNVHDSVLSARGMDRIKDVDSSNDEDEDLPARYPLSTPNMQNLLQEDWVKAWGQAWGLQVNKTEEKRRRNRLNALQTKRDQSGVAVYVNKQVGNQSVEPVLGKSVTKASMKQSSPTGPKSPAKSKTQKEREWVVDSAEKCGHFAKSLSDVTPLKSAVIRDQSMASAEKTVKKSKWVFGDDELTEDEEDEKLGEENLDGEEAWNRSARKQNRALEPFRKHINLDGNQKQKRVIPDSFRILARTLREQLVESDEGNNPEHQSFSKPTPDLAILRRERQKLRNDDADYRPLFRRSDGRLVRKPQDDPVAIPTVLMPTVVGQQDRVGAWV